MLAAMGDGWEVLSVHSEHMTKSRQDPGDLI